MSTKKYFFRIAILLIAIGSVAFLYWDGFYKTYDEKCVPQKADAIAMVDVKNIRNHFVFSFVKNPSEWGTTRTKKRFSLSNLGLKTPDYLAFFHIENQPVTQWFVVLKIENEAVFEKAVVQKHFNKTKPQNGMSAYYSNALNLCIIKHLNQILVSNISGKQTPIAVKTAEDLFLKKLFLDAKKTGKMIGTSNAVTFWIKKNSLLNQDGILNLTLEEREITIDGHLNFQSKFQKESQFLQNPNALLSLGFNFEMIRNQDILKLNSAKINKIIGFNLDSILTHNPTKTELLLNKIVEKKDSAISYDYDDDFNPIKKVVIRINREPSFYFSIQTANSKKVFDYLKNQKAIDYHSIFVNFPLAQTKAFVKGNSLKLEANPLKKYSRQASVSKIAYLQVHFDKLHPKDWHFIIAKNKKFSFLKSFETLEIGLSKENNLCHFRAHLTTNSDKSLIAVIK